MTMRRPKPGKPGFLRDTRGAAASEFVLWLGLLIFPLLSAVDVGVYIFQKMQLEIAAQAAVQAAWSSCDEGSKLPAVENCGDLSGIITTAAQSTSLGSYVTVVAGSPVENYYCVDDLGDLLPVGTDGTIGSPPTKPTPFTCASVIGGSTTEPADYIRVTVSFDYTPVFPGVSVVSLLETPITRTAWMRLS